ncbi:MAG: hypothetical protein EXS38_07985 [Opitutus sp.]|nr:hypothetical protein [Opitutus sp.]
MAIRSKNDLKPDDKTFELPAERSFRNDPEKDKKIDLHIAANPRDFEHYTDLVKNYPDRAIRTLIHKDQQRYEQDMKLVTKQLPAAKEFYQKQAPEVQQRIDRNLTGVNPYFHDKAFVGEVLREMDRQNRRSLAAGPAAPAPTPSPVAAMSAG